MTFDWGAYVGISHRKFGRDISSGVDCWGLTRAVLMAAGVDELPIYGAFTCDLNGADAVAREKANGDWRAVPLDASQVFDVAVMRSPVKVDGRWVNLPVHVGVIAPNRLVLHIHEETASVMQPLDALRHRIVEIFRHKRF
jgi:hypothetical protein